mgnify:CR=1 FL=1|tara:strand:+ start:2217 stop:4139 length:1923 start_codon:yes stop_codon:yes gene_type:complete
MAKSYFAYQTRDPQAEVDWTEIASNFNNVLLEEARVRTEKKKAIDDNTREFQRRLNDIPQGTSTSIREWGLKYSTQAQEQMLMQEKLLKSGALKYGDYTVMRQNLVDGTDDAFNLIQEYQDVYATKMERMKSDNPDMSSQGLEVWLMKNAEGFGNFDQSQLVINPETGKVSASFKTRNPKTGEMEITDNPNSLRSVSALRGQLLGEFDEYNLEAKTAEWVAGNGKWQQVIREIGSYGKAGLITTITNPMEKLMTVDGTGKRVFDIEKAKALGIPEAELEVVNLYITAQDDWIQGQMANKLTVSSVLTENVAVASNGKAFDFTWDAAEAAANPEMIQLDPNTNQPIFDKKNNPHAEAQEDAVIAAFKVSINNKQNIVQDAKTNQDITKPNQPQEWDKNRGDKKEADKDQIGNVAKLWYGTEAEILEAEKSLRALNPNIKSFNRTPMGVEVVYQDDSRESMLFNGPTGDPLAQDEWVTANANYILGNKVGNIPTLLKNASLDLSRQLNTTSTVFDQGTGAPKTQTDLETTYAYMDNNKDTILDTQLLYNKKNQDAIPGIVAALGKYGASLNSQETALGRNGFTIKGADGVVSPSYNTNNNAADAAQMKSDMIQFVKDHMTDEAAARAVTSGAVKKGKGKYDN